MRCYSVVYSVLLFGRYIHGVQTTTKSHVSFRKVCQTGVPPLQNARMRPDGDSCIGAPTRHLPVQAPNGIVNRGICPPLVVTCELQYSRGQPRAAQQTEFKLLCRLETCPARRKHSRLLTKDVCDRSPADYERAFERWHNERRYSHHPALPASLQCPSTTRRRGK